VHALDDLLGGNPDALTRVDYRTKGPGWAPAPGATGEGPGGNNWQDTATEQWIRGEAVLGTIDPSMFFYSNLPNANPDAVQPYATNVPLWLADGTGADYDFSTEDTHQIAAGRMNPLATPIIPGDTDRDGDADQDDVDKLAAVFADADWIFSNSYGTAPQGDSGDPATQARPWDVDLTGDNGIEPRDLQWVLNVQGDTTGRVVGRRYDSPTPSATGVHLDPAATVGCAVTTSAVIPSGRTLATLEVGDTVEVTVSAQVTGGAVMVAGQENGVMQYAHDLAISTGGVLRVTGIQASAPFAATRSGVTQLEGAAGDAGASLINGYTTSFVRGLGAPAALYIVELTAIGEGSASVSLTEADHARIAASTPNGLKVGHTASNGNPATVSYPAPLAATVTSGGGCPQPGCEVADLDGDCTVSLSDLAVTLANFGTPSGAAHEDGDLDGDGDVDLTDLSVMLSLFGTNCN